MSPLSCLLLSIGVFLSFNLPPYAIIRTLCHGVNSQGFEGFGEEQWLESRTSGLLVWSPCRFRFQDLTLDMDTKKRLTAHQVVVEENGRRNTSKRGINLHVVFFSRMEESICISPPLLCWNRQPSF